MAIRLILVDDHPIVLTGLQQILASQADFEVVAQCADGASALEAVQQHQPDIVILDLRLPDMDGIEVARQLHAMELPTRVVLLTAGLADNDVFEAFQLGVRGIVLKETALRVLVQCLRKVHAGGQWIERDSLTRAFERMLKREAGAREAAAVLTPRELEVVRLVAQGQRNKEMAAQLGIAEGTVKIHLHNIYEKLDVDGRAQLMIYAQEKGLT